MSRRAAIEFALCVLIGGCATQLVLAHDQAVAINTNYARPNPALPIRYVWQRLYRGFCAMNGEFEWVRQHLNERRVEVEGVFDSERVGERQRNRALDYVRESYKIINDPEQMTEDIVEACRG